MTKMLVLKFYFSGTFFCHLSLSRYSIFSGPMKEVSGVSFDLINAIRPRRHTYCVFIEFRWTVSIMFGVFPELQSFCAIILLCLDLIDISLSHPIHFLQRLFYQKDVECSYSHAHSRPYLLVHANPHLRKNLPAHLWHLPKA